jgi:molecular chaperone GrpE
LILRELLAALEKNGVFVIDPKDEEFNPEEHEAISVTEAENVDPNICLEVVQKGYKFKDRIIRPAMVVVTKK